MGSVDPYGHMIPTAKVQLLVGWLANDFVLFFPRGPPAGSLLGGHGPGKLRLMYATPMLIFVRGDVVNYVGGNAGLFGFGLLTSP